MNKVTKLPTQAPQRGTYRYADLVLSAYHRMFGDGRDADEREQRRQLKERKSQVEQAAKQRL